jgi:hypothetical protein
VRWFHLIFILITLYVCYIFYNHVSDLVYYLWDKTKDAVMMTAITVLLRRNYDSKYVIRVSQASTAFIIVRVLTEYIILLFPALDHPATLNFLFCLNWAVVVYVFFYAWITKMFFNIRVYWAYVKFWFRNKQKA